MPASPRRRSAAGGPRRPATVQQESSGGVVVDLLRAGEPAVAVIARYNRGGRLEWCLPKGHLEAGETAEDAAVREIAEETGISGRVLAPLGDIEYWFSADGHRVHKVVHHYLLEATGGAISVEGDPDAEAVDAAWVPLSACEQRLAFANERRIVRDAAALLDGLLADRRR